MNVQRRAEYQRCLQMMRDPQRRSWIILSPTSIGDTATICALAQEFVKAHGHAITLVVTPEHLPVTQMYPNRFLRVLTMDRGQMHQFIHSYVEPHRFELDVPFVAHPFDHGDGRGDELMYLHKYPGRGGLTFTDMFRNLLRLPWQSKLERPTIPQAWADEAQRFADQAGVIPGKSVLLLPKNSSNIGQFRDHVWTKVVERLHARGYKVFCNMKGGIFQPPTMPVRGAIPIEVPVHLAPSFVKIAGRVISSSNGMQFLQMLGGQFDLMTVMFPVFGNFEDFEQNGRKYAPVTPISQYMCPEMCVGINFSEYGVPVAGSDADLERIAIAVADDDRTDFNCARRFGTSGSLYTEENAGWLSELVTPLTSNAGVSIAPVVA